MDATGKELEPNRAILDLGIQDEEQRDKQWAVQGYMRGLQKPGSMSDTQGACQTLVRFVTNCSDIDPSF